MITNDRQYKIAKSQLLKFEESLGELSKVTPSIENVHPLFVEAHRNAIASEIKELNAKIHEYEALKAGEIVVAEVKKLEDLPNILIKARIANGLTQAELAEKLDMKEQQVQRYESESYGTASLKTLLKITSILNISINGDVQLKEIETKENVELLDARNYPFKEMYKRKWFRTYSSLNEAVQKSESILFQLFDKSGLYRKANFGFNRRSIRTNSEYNQFALNAWYAQVILKSQEQKLKTVFDANIITGEWLANLAELSVDKDGPIKAANYLRNSGIRFVVEPQLEGTYLDGAAMLMEDKNPVIAMTLRYDRLDNFWFVLFHEIAHVHLHLGDNYEAIFDDLDSKTDGIEKEADEFALDSLIPKDVWRKTLVRFSPSSDAIKNLAKRMNVHTALIAGRIRKETGKYHQFTDLVGQGEVRKLFIEELN